MMSRLQKLTKSHSVHGIFVMECGISFKAGKQQMFKCQKQHVRHTHKYWTKIKAGIPPPLMYGSEPKLLFTIYHPCLVQCVYYYMVLMKTAIKLKTLLFIVVRPTLQTDHISDISRIMLQSTHKAQAYTFSPAVLPLNNKII